MAAGGPAGGPKRRAKGAPYALHLNGSPDPGVGGVMAGSVVVGG